MGTSDGRHRATPFVGRQRNTATEPAPARGRPGRGRRAWARAQDIYWGRQVGEEGTDLARWALTVPAGTIRARQGGDSVVTWGRTRAWASGGSLGERTA